MDRGAYTTSIANPPARPWRRRDILRTSTPKPMLSASMFTQAQDSLIYADVSGDYGEKFKANDSRYSTQSIVLHFPTHKNAKAKPSKPAQNLAKRVLHVRVFIDTTEDDLSEDTIQDESSDSYSDVHALSLSLSKPVHMPAKRTESFKKMSKAIGKLRHRNNRNFGKLRLRNNRRVSPADMAAIFFLKL